MTIRFKVSPHPWRLPMAQRRRFGVHHVQRMYWICDLLGATRPVQGSSKDVETSCLPRPLASPHSQLRCLGSKLGPAIQGWSGGSVTLSSKEKGHLDSEKKEYIHLKSRFFHFSSKAFDSHRLFNPTIFCISILVCAQVSHHIPHSQCYSSPFLFLR